MAGSGCVGKHPCLLRPAMKPHPLIGSMMNSRGARETSAPQSEGHDKLSTCRVIGLPTWGVERTDFLRWRGRMAWGIKQLDSANSLTMVTGRPIIIYPWTMVLSVQFGCRPSNVLVSYSHRFWVRTKWQIVYFILRPIYCICFCFTDEWRLRVDLWVSTLPARFMIVCTINGRDFSLISCHPWRKCYPNKVNSIVKNNHIQSALKAAVGLLESCEQVWHRVGRWPLSGRYSASIGSPSWFTSHNMKPCQKRMFRYIHA